MTTRVICLGTAWIPGLCRMELPVPNKAGIAKLRAEMNGLNFALSIDTSESTWWISMIQQPSREWLRELVQKIEDFFQAKCQYHLQSKPLSQDEWITYIRGSDQ